MIIINYNKKEMDTVPKKYRGSIFNPFKEGDGSWESFSEEETSKVINTFTIC